MPFTPSAPLFPADWSAVRADSGKWYARGTSLGETVAIGPQSKAAAEAYAARQNSQSAEIAESDAEAIAWRKARLESLRTIRAARECNFRKTTPDLFESMGLGSIYRESI